MQLKLSLADLKTCRKSVYIRIHVAIAWPIVPENSIRAS